MKVANVLKENVSYIVSLGIFSSISHPQMFIIKRQNFLHMAFIFNRAKILFLSYLCNPKTY